MLEINLVKKEQGVDWLSLLKDIVIPSSELSVQPIRDLSLPPAHNIRSEMEECDFGDEDCDREFTFGMISLK